jgi:hypothetical protein
MSLSYSSVAERRRRRRKTPEIRSFSTPPTTFVGHLFQAKHHTYLVEIRSYSQLGYNLDNFFLNIFVIQSACNVFMYPAII